VNQVRLRRAAQVAFLICVGACTRVPEPPSEIVRACQTATACSITATLQSCATDYFQWLENPDDPPAFHMGPNEIGCLANAGTDCDRARACVNLGVAPGPCSDPMHPVCDGDVFRYCCGLQGMTCAFDCASAGQHCFAQSNGDGICAVESCDVAGASCDGNSVVFCRDGLEQRRTCSTNNRANNLTCGVSKYPPNPIECVATGPSCVEGSIRCEGDTLVVCPEGREERFDCTVSGLRCVRGLNTPASPSPYVCGSGSECDYTAQPSCDGGRYRYCWLGSWLTTDCKAAGFSGCNYAGCTL
jgi:hypothetical protein